MPPRSCVYAAPVPSRMLPHLIAVLTETTFNASMADRVEL
jgi:hypothetical protein